MQSLASATLDTAYSLAGYAIGECSGCTLCDRERKVDFAIPVH
jgi:hypothetical protein